VTWIPLLLADPSASLRQLVLRDLMDTPDDDDEVRELDSLRLSDPLAAPVLDAQEPDGAWSLPGDGEESEDSSGREGYTMIPLQTALPLRALAMCGYATDPRTERAYE
jgi:hypothetical protein